MNPGVRYFTMEQDEDVTGERVLRGSGDNGKGHMTEAGVEAEEQEIQKPSTEMSSMCLRDEKEDCINGCVNGKESFGLVRDRWVGSLRALNSCSEDLRFCYECSGKLKAHSNGE